MMYGEWDSEQSIETDKQFENGIEMSKYLEQYTHNR